MSGRVQHKGVGEYKMVKKLIFDDTYISYNVVCVK